MLALALLLQAAAPSPAPAETPAPERFSILVKPCAKAGDDAGGDVIVCGQPGEIGPRMPLPRYRGKPDHPVPSNPDMTGAAALNGPGIGTECGAYGEDCPGDLVPTVYPVIVKGVANAIHSLVTSHPKVDKKGRVPIPLDDPAPVDLTGKVTD